MGLSTIRGILDKVVSQFTFASNTPINEVTGTLATLSGSARIINNKLNQTTQSDFMTWPATLFAANEDFTIETWVNYSGTGSGGGCIMGVWNIGNSNNNAWIAYVTSNVLWFSISPTGTSSGQFNLNSGTLSPNVNHHVAITRQAGTVRVFVDGVIRASGPFAEAAASSTLPCRTVWSANTTLLANIWNMRIAKGACFYAANFTPPQSF